MQELETIQYGAGVTTARISEGRLPLTTQPERQRGMWSFLTWSFLLAQIALAEQFIGRAGTTGGEETALGSLPEDADDVSAAAVQSADQVSIATETVSNPSESNAFASAIASELAPPRLAPVDAAAADARAQSHQGPPGAVSAAGSSAGSGHTAEHSSPGDGAEIGDSTSDPAAPVAGVNDGTQIDTGIVLDSAVGLDELPLLDLGIGIGVTLVLNSLDGVLSALTDQDLPDLLVTLAGVVDSVDGTLADMVESLPATVGAQVDALSSAVSVSAVVDSVDGLADSGLTNVLGVLGNNVQQAIFDGRQLSGDASNLVDAATGAVLDGLVGSGSITTLDGSIAASGAPLLTQAYSTFAIELQTHDPSAPSPFDTSTITQDAIDTAVALPHDDHGAPTTNLAVTDILDPLHDLASARVFGDLI